MKTAVVCTSQCQAVSPADVHGYGHPVFPEHHAPVISVLRLNLGLVQRLLCLAKLNWRELGFSTISCSQQTLPVHLTYKHRDTAQELLVRNTDIKFLGEGVWKR